MKNPINIIQEEFWINVYYSDNPKAPICTLEFVNKANKDERYKHAVWRDKENHGKGYIGKEEPPRDRPQSQPVEQVQEVQGLDDEIPFAWALPFVPFIGLSFMVA